MFKLAVILLPFLGTTAYSPQGPMRLSRVPPSPDQITVSVPPRMPSKPDQITVSVPPRMPYSSEKVPPRKFNTSLIDLQNDKMVDIDFDNHKSTFSIKGMSFGTININNQNISFLDESRIEHLELRLNSTVYINKHTSFKSLDISDRSELHLKDCDISSDDPINVNGTLDISGIVKLINTTVLLSRGSSFTNTGTISLGKSSRVVIERSAVVELINNITSTGHEFGLVVNGNAHTSVDISIDTPILLNIESNFIVNSFTRVRNVTSYGSIKVNNNSTLFVSDSTFFYDSTRPIIAPARRLQQSSQPGVCVFQNSVLTGNGVLDCNVIFSGDIMAPNNPSVLIVESLYIDSISSVTMDTNDIIISKNDITLGGFLILDLSKYTSSFTILKSEKGNITGRFRNTVPNVIYTINSVYVTVDKQSEQVRQDDTGIIIIPVVACVGLLIIISGIFIYRYKSKPIVVSNPPPPSDDYVYYINPIKNNV
jgi:hypothetical protein